MAWSCPTQSTTFNLSITMRCLTLIVLLIVSSSVSAHAQYGASIDGQLKYPAGFTKFDYVSDKAAQGGRLVLHDIGSFDKINPFTLKGSVAYGLEDLVYEPLGVQSLDEPFSLYGLIAKDITVASDHKSVVFTLDENARFSDGSPIEVEDIAYTIETLTGGLVHPFYNSYYQDIAGYKTLGKDRIRVDFKTANREMHLIVAQMKIMPRKAHGSFFSEGFQLTDDKFFPLGSGPYVVAELTPGKSITYKKNPDYWAARHATRIGMFNFDEIVVKYYKDQVVALEAFKAGEFDFISINIAKQWARDLDGKKFRDGNLIKKAYPHKNIAGMQGFTMNTRRPLFQDVKVRRALGLALNFEWINEALFHSQYQRNDSFFSNSLLAARRLPKGLELEYLTQYKSVLPPEVFTTELSSPKVQSDTDLRQNLLQAKELLAQAGWEIKDGVLTNESGQVFAFDFLLSSQAFERVLAIFANNLRKLGIVVHYRTTDPALYVSRVKAFDYDMIVTSFSQSQSPGNEQMSYWHSSSVTKSGSRNYAGINSSVVDDLVAKIIYATNRDELTAACNALDRVLWYGYYTIPNWFLPVHRLSYSKDFAQPDTLPLYYSPFQTLMTWWKK
ncbi:MAG: microcin C transport system substrate-binding protein [Desulforhopalus sp.]|jgi:microcin C transport system substrate-binding protein